MHDLLETLTYTIPAVIVFLTTLVMLRIWSRNEERRRSHEFNMHLTDEVLPVRLQAYERIILLLERISPDSLVMRISRPEFSARQFQQEMLKSVKSEYDHNIAQQVYVSAEAWDRVKMARNQVTTLVNEAASELKSDATGKALGTLVLERMTELKNPPTQEAIDFLKREVKTLFL